jgi:2-polyprenyl-3-methyl-5-hydroxy-6-metoxy-1,4-benzoquinol methylase
MDEAQLRTEPVAVCPICGDERREVLYTGLVDRLHGAPGIWRMQRCTLCGAAYLDPRPTLEGIAIAYDDYYTHEPTPEPAAHPGRLRRARRALRNGYLNARFGSALEPATRFGRLVVPFLPGARAAADRHVRQLSRPRAGARLLDVGCGNGEFLLEMRAAGWAGEGIELDARAVARAREHSLEVREGHLEPGAFPADSFDAVTLSHVLEHLHDPVATLEVCGEILRADGVLWIATPNLSSPGHARFGRAWRGLEPPRHLVLFTATALDHALGRAGFGRASYLRPASARWVYERSARLSSSGGSARGRAGRLASVLANARSAGDHRRGEELVAAARPRSAHQTFQGA